MKRTLVWRWVLIGVVMVGWFASLFPLHDREFLVIFERLAGRRVARLQSEATDLAQAADGLKNRLEAVTEKDSEEYRKLQKKHETARADADAAAAAVKTYEDLMSRAAAMRAENPELAQYKSIELAAKGDANHGRVRLTEYVPIPGSPKASNKRVLKFVRDKAAGRLRLGLDLRGGTEFVISFSEEEAAERDKNAEQVRDQIIEILRNRLDMMGLVEPEIKPLGRNTLSVRMPMLGEGAKADIRDLLKQQANLQFYLVDPANAQKVAEYRADPVGFTPSPGYRYAEIEGEEDGETVTEVIFIKETAEELDGSEVQRASPAPSEFGNWWRISLELKDRGARQFARITTDHVNERLAIVMDGRVYSAPNINEPITGGRAEITGDFTFDEAKRLAGVIESGNLPVNITIDSEFGTDPTLGADSIRSGIWAAVAGLLLVVAFMVYYYRFAGVVAVLALACNMLLVLGTLTLSRATITLPGIAGMVLTIGMAVDANVLIFERIREELRNGKTIGNAIKAGYSRAFVTILDSNLTTLLTALILYQFGTGPIKGFAVTLGIGIVASMFTSLFMTRCVFDTRLETGRFTHLGMNAIKAITDCRYDFLGVKRVTTIASVSLVALAMICLVGRGRDALSIDFAGGTEISYDIQGEEPDVAAVRGHLNQQGFSNIRVGYKFSGATGMRMLEVVLPKTSTNETDRLDTAVVEQSLNSAFPSARLKQVQTNSVGNLVGAQFQMRALLAAFLAILGIVVYISFRFEFAYAVASVIALLHDVIIAAGLYLLLGWFGGGRQLSLPVVAALLTIIGYSLNDTIVVFDRIREDLSLHRNRSYVDIVNLSINQTLSRTTLTSLTTLIVVVTLFIFGGGAINDFALVMLLGVVVGTYSSIFVASAIIATWHRRGRATAKD
ncbi:MAG: protein translocase subunit SecD [Lentisphaeria bacterium]|nr:protein translocase subunit SecD [Lentisphaeria bacterium]